jgi:hypothetical protein
MNRDFTVFTCHRVFFPATTSSTVIVPHRGAITVEAKLNPWSRYREREGGEVCVCVCVWNLPSINLLQYAP